MKAPRLQVCVALLIFLLISPFFSARASRSQDQPGVAAATAIQFQQVLTGLSTPVLVTNAGDGANRLFVIEQAGIIRVAQPGAATSTVFLDITSRVLFIGERGLLGLAFHPFYKNNGRFFVYYTRAGDGSIVIAEYHVSVANPNIADTAEIPILVVPHPTFDNHNGGTIAFGPDGYLYAAPGDGGGGNDTGNNAQNINQLLGKFLRIDIDHPNGATPYSSPSSNPFFGDLVAGRDEIFAVGMRNPFRFTFDRGGTHQLYVGDVGQNAWEEIDIITVGANYGWRVFEGAHCTGNDPTLCSPASACTINGYTCPITEYSSLNPDPRCAVTGGYVYRGPIATVPTGVYLFADYCTGDIYTLSPPGPGGTQTPLIDSPFLISSFGEDEAGEEYLTHLGGSVQRMTNSTAPCSSAVSPSSQSFAAIGGSGTAAVTTPVNCPWMATSNNSFIHITAGSAGTGAGAVSYTVDANSSTNPRGGTLTIAGQTLTILQGAAFADVPVNHPFYSDIGKLSARGVTLGCAPGVYCPDSEVTREQMSAFIMRARGEFNPPTPPTQRFDDVPPSSVFYNFVDRLAVLGITLGCGSGNYCPTLAVTREQMSAFMLRALGETSPPSTTFQRFADVPPSNPFFAFIDRIAIRGITNGCTTVNYCPSGSVTRAQMAAFLVRAFNL